jgi:Mce-associated membrane protein
MKWLSGRPHPLVLALSVTVLLALGLAGAAWFAGDRAQRQDQAATDALAAATAASQAIFSYDYRGFDASVANGVLFVTGDFAKEYAQTTSELKAAAEKEHAIVRAEVSMAGVVEARPDRVEVLLYLNQYRRNINITGEKVDQNRVVLTMVPAVGGWRVAHAVAM